jgi:hypothetical protein
VQRRVAGAEEAHSRRRHAQAARRVVVLDRLHGDVVAEPLGLLVRVGVTADVDEQRRVVDDRPLPLVEPHPLGQPQRDQALTQDVLHRLTEAEIDPQRQRRNQLRQPDVRAIGLARAHFANHTQTSTTGRAAAQRTGAIAAARRCATESACRQGAVAPRCGVIFHDTSWDARQRSSVGQRRASAHSKCSRRPPRSLTKSRPRVGDSHRAGGIVVDRSAPGHRRSDTNPRRGRVHVHVHVQAWPPIGGTGGAPGRPPVADARAADQEDADSSSPMFLVTTSIVRPSSSVGLNSTTSVPA